MQTIRFLRNPDAMENAGGIVTDTKKSVVKQLNADIDLGSVATKVNQSWIKNPSISLAWITQAEFGADASAFNKTVTDRNTIASSRPSITHGIKTYDDEIETAVGEVKIYIAKKYKKTGAVAQYSRFGINKSANGYRFPLNQENRMASLKLMADSIVADGMGDEEYGKMFWTNMLASYTKAVSDASGSDQLVSGTVSEKNVLRTRLLKVFSALRLVLRGNYPDTYASTFRTWGWMKEKY